MECRGSINFVTRIILTDLIQCSSAPEHRHADITRAKYEARPSRQKSRASSGAHPGSLDGFITLYGKAALRARLTNCQAGLQWVV